VHPFFILNFGYIGTAIGVGMGLYAVLPRARKHVGRKLAQFLVGGYMLGLLGLVARENMQIEGFFFYLLAGYFGGAVMHYLVAKLVGPLLFGRGWCAWACWTAMILDLLPFAKSPGRTRAPWGHLRYVVFAASLALVLALWLGLGYRARAGSLDALWWLLGGNALYYASGLVLAWALRDNRAFCKYVCPIVLPLKAGSRFALMKIGGRADACDACGKCDAACPMDIKVGEHLRRSGRVLSTECIFCQSCLNTCPQRIPRITFGFDAGFRERLRRRGEPRTGAA